MSAQRASLGRCSLISRPGTFVAIGLNSPRNSLGASGLRSKVSMCDGPPPRFTKIAEVALPGRMEPALAIRK